MSAFRDLHTTAGAYAAPHSRKAIRISFVSRCMLIMLRGRPLVGSILGTSLRRMVFGMSQPSGLGLPICLRGMQVFVTCAQYDSSQNVVENCWRALQTAAVDPGNE